MEKSNLSRWAELLLDLGKGNNLVNFKDVKLKTVEILLPEMETLFEKADHGTVFDVFDTKTDVNEDSDVEQTEETFVKEDYFLKYQSKVKKQKELLLFNRAVEPLRALKNIQKTARTAIEETGVNIAYMVFGFIQWTESDNSETTYRAPLLLMPITIKNESALEPYHVKTEGDEFILNPTFKYKVFSEYGIELPEYNDEGITEYLNKIRELVSSLKWSVLAESKIGIFSFLKINMYTDLKENSLKIEKNEIVKSLLGKSLSQEEQMPMQIIDLSDLKNVVDCDSSQAEAISLAKSGKSFVLQGPPGTGKSQTITNLIAESLNDGKKVLFVSEKLAALSVVYDKLKKAGLEDFCLELHSHKANKKEFIDELCRTLKESRSNLSSSADIHTQERKRTQKDLNEYAKELHVKREVINRSLYELYSEYSRYKDVPEFYYPFKEIESKGDSFLREGELLFNEYQAYVPTIGYNYKFNAWYGYRGQDFSYQTKLLLKENMQKLLSFLPKFNDLSFKSERDFYIKIKNISQAENLNKLIEVIISSPFIKAELLTENLKKVYEKVEKLKEKADEIYEIRKNVLVEYDKELLDVDPIERYKKLSREYKGALKRAFSSDYKKIIKDLKLCKNDGVKPKYNQALEVYKKLYDITEITAQIVDIAKPIKNKINGYDKEKTDFESLLSDLSILLELQSSGVDVSIVKDLVSKKTELQDFKKELSSVLEQIKSSFNYVKSSFSDTLFDFSVASFENIEAKITSCLDSFDGVENYVAFYELLTKIQKLGLIEFLDKTIEANVPTKQISNAFKKVFVSEWIQVILHRSSILRELSRVPHDNLVNVFREKDKLQFEINKAEIKSNLSSKRPDTEFIPSGSPIGVLLREGEKKRRLKSVRLLMQEIGDFIQLLKPCFLMSPLSVSTFLQSEKVNFDLVIFDEASQIFPQDAIGAIYRAKQLIVVGDSKQMPPSNFFNSTQETLDEDALEDVTDFESILDLCSTVLPQKRLKWHYRSRYEELIAFSNKNFYSGDLVTFPSSKKQVKGYGVDFYYVEGGTFDHKSKSNRKEAERVVELIYENINLYPERSLGVVAFSISQQDLIERLLTKKRRELPLLESYFRSDAKEPFFIKNLETVQGDERDTIIFSVGYAKDETGKLLHNFGPLNRAGGERRLNVAVTRAKQNVQLVSSLKYTDIDLKRTSAKGASLLREYLDYAENGAVALLKNMQVDKDDSFDSGFETEVCEFLRENGYTVDTQVGCSSFRIDLAVRRKNSGDYVLAVECDGATYHSSKTARDRDRLRQDILEQMGWKFYRIWSTDWFKNKAVEKKRLIEAVESALFAYPEQQREEQTEVINFSETESETHFNFPVYEEANFLSIRINTYDYVGFVKGVLKIEAPLSEEFFLKRNLKYFNATKLTERVYNEHNTLMYGAREKGIIRRNGFMYLDSQKEYVMRVPSETTKRDIKDISYEELASGIVKLVEICMITDKDGLYKMLAKALGYSRVTDVVYQRIEEAFELVKDKFSITGNMISLRK